MARNHNTIQLFCGKSTEAVPQFSALEKAGFEIESVPAFSNKHVFHLAGRCNRSVAMIITPGANPYDIAALIADSEVGNPFLVWSPDQMKHAATEWSRFNKKLHTTGSISVEERGEFDRLAEQMKKQRKPIIFYGRPEEWQSFNDAINHLIEAKTMRPGIKDNMVFCATQDDVTQVLDERIPKDWSGLSSVDHKSHVYGRGSEPIDEFIAKDDTRTRPRITISFFGSASTRLDSHLKSARRSVEMCQRQGWGLVNGGGVYGVMGAQLHAAKELDVYTHGISAHESGAVAITGTEKDPDIITKLITKYSDHKDMIHRIESYLEHSEGIALLDGGIGSAHELFMVLELFRDQHKSTLYQDTTGHWHKKPFIVIDEHGTWEPFIEKWARKTYGDEYLSPLKLVKSVEEAEALFADQYAKHKPKLATDIIDRIVLQTEKELASVIPHLQRVTTSKDGRILSAATSGRPATVKDWQNTMSLVDLTNLKDEATQDDITKLCDTAKLQHTRSICVRSKHVAYAKECLKGSGIKVITVTNFPKGELPVESAVNKMQAASKLKVDEIDTVMPRHLIKEKKFSECLDYLRRVISSVNVPVKVILETADLTPEQIAQASIIAKTAGAASVKTSTDRHPSGGAEVEAVEIMRRSVGNNVGVSASGGVKEFEQAMAMIEAGADVIGSSGLSITSQQERIPSARITLHGSQLPGYALMDRNSARSAGG